MDDCTGWLGLAQANRDFGFWIGDFGLLIPEFARLSAIESVALVPRLDISFAKESLLRRGAGSGGGGAGDLNDQEKLLEIVRPAHQRFLRLRILARAGDRRYADKLWRANCGAIALACPRPGTHFAI